jgi:hypothetical protein
MSDLAQRLRDACASVRTKSYPLADLIPLMQQAADALSEPPNTVSLPAAEWHALDFWLDRCERKGHLDNCPDLIEPYIALCDAITKAATPAQEPPKEPTP